ncbi:MAG: 16S rRNA (guanine(966)-N(2))-methyltransferase RsmD [Comamonadaceae bacterium]|nr:MAG: 16S rRNA (guanine(966)-N(2))-methyltransferase RsmD [Comamonadaceae bacterium]
MPRKPTPALSSKPAPRPAAKPVRQPTSAAPSRLHEIRIIGGQWRRSRLPVADRPGLRPTPDRVRETLFNWLASRAGVGGGELPGWQCLDLFAGTGALGFEAASRGASAVTLCEQEPSLAAQLQATCERLHAEAVQVHRGDGVARLERMAAGSLHVVFVDPPFEQSALYQRALRAAVPALRPDGVIYLEADKAWDADALAPHGLQVLRHLRAGAVHGHLLAAVSAA